MKAGYHRQKPFHNEIIHDEIIMIHESTSLTRLIWTLLTSYIWTDITAIIRQNINADHLLQSMYIHIDLHVHHLLRSSVNNG